MFYPQPNVSILANGCFSNVHSAGGVASDGPIPLPPRLRISRSVLNGLNYLRLGTALELAVEDLRGGQLAGFGDYLAAEDGVFGEAV